MKKRFSLLLPLLLCAFRLHALSLWSYPECAGKNAVFVSVLSPAVSFTGGFALRPPYLALDYMLPFGLPLSLGAFLVSPDPNLKNFGGRAAYHVDIDNENVDLYFLYVCDFGWLRNDLLIEYNDTPVERHWFDFRAGVRRRFGRFVCMQIETGFKLQEIIFGLAIKVF